jgi:hypothetical protein
MGAVERARVLEAAARSRADALASLNLERLLAFADSWRRLAQQWTEQSKECAPEWVEPLRTRAQLALYAAHEADDVQAP